MALEYRPIRTLNIGLWLTDAVRGTGFIPSLGTPEGGKSAAGVRWSGISRVYGLRASYQVINDSVPRGGSFQCFRCFRDQRWIRSPYFYGQKNTLNIGATFGF